MHPDTAHFYDGTREPERIDAARRRRARPRACPRRDLPDYGDVRRGGRRRARPGRADAADARRRHDRRLGGGRDARPRAHAHRPRRPRDADHPRRPARPRVFTPWFDYGYSNDPVAEFLGSLDRVEALGPFALALPGHGRALEDVPAIIADHRDGRRDAARRDGRRDPRRRRQRPTRSSRRVFGDLEPTAMVWRLTEIVAYLRHLRLAGAITPLRGRDGCLPLRAERGTGMKSDRLDRPAGCRARARRRRGCARSSGWSTSPTGDLLRDHCARGTDLGPARRPST